MSLAVPASADAYADATAELFALQGRGIKLGLENIRSLLDVLGAPDRRFRIVQVAGTNGKGSVSSFLEAGLRSAGLRTGLFTSPHLVDFRERVQVDGRPIGEPEVVAGWREIRAEIERRAMTFFEANTALALAYFARRGCEVAVLETGLGGRLDATTATRPEAVVLTRIAFDHKELLGETLAAIAAEKAAVVRDGAAAFSAPQALEVERVIRERARAAGSPVEFVADPGGVEVGTAETRFLWRGTPVSLRMVGRHQAQNAALALAALAHLLPDVAPATLAAAVGQVRVPGRFQLVPCGAGALVLDVAHNPDAIAAFARALREAHPGRPKRAFLAMLRDKDVAGAIEALDDARVARPILVGSAASAPAARRLRRRHWNALPADVRTRGRWVGGVAAGLAELEEWLARTPGGVAAVSGSFTSVGEAMQALGLDPLGSFEA